MGAMALQGPHQGAQKSISTGASDFSTSCSKLASVTSMIPLDAITLSEKVDQLTSYHLAVQRLDAVGCGKSHGGIRAGRGLCTAEAYGATSRLEIKSAPERFHPRAPLGS